jgi:hypothetical protein
MISHPHKTIFVHIPKTGGRSIEKVFYDDLSLSNNVRNPFLLQENSDTGYGPRRLSHLKATEYFDLYYISREIWDSYLKFSVVRDPWMRTISLYKYMYFPGSFQDFVKFFVRKKLDGMKNVFLDPQYQYVCDKNRKVIVDYILKIENLDKDFQIISEKTSVNSEIPHINISSKRIRIRPTLILKGAAKAFQAEHDIRLKYILGKKDNKENWKELYDEESRDVIRKIYEKDFEMFGYDIDALS